MNVLLVVLVLNLTLTLILVVVELVLLDNSLMEMVFAKTVLKVHTQIHQDPFNVIHVDVVVNLPPSLQPQDVLTVKQEISQCLVELVSYVNPEHTLLMMVLAVVLLVPLEHKLILLKQDVHLVQKDHTLLVEKTAKIVLLVNTQPMMEPLHAQNAHVVMKKISTQMVAKHVM